jgi:Reverse transcriptase (RNA-dependent DNA polymerase)
MQDPDSEQFVKALQDNIDGQTANENSIIVPKDHLHKDTRILPSIWAMRQKRKVMDGTIYMWKARLNIDGGKQIQGLDYWDTCAPVTSWSIICLILLISILNRGIICQLDFVQAFPQTPIQTELFMEIPKGYTIIGNRNDHVLKLIRNISPYWFLSRASGVPYIAFSLSVLIFRKYLFYDHSE